MAFKSLQTYAPMKKLLIPFIIAFGFPAISFSQQYGWKDISENIPTEANLSDVFFVTDDEGWIVSATHAEIYHTINGGETFDIQITQFPCTSIHMLNENEGYSGGHNGRVYRTTDGGENWIAIGSMGTTLADIYFPPTADTGYACGLNGNIWKVSSSGLEKMTSYINGDLNSISFPLSHQKGWVLGGAVIRQYTDNEWTGNQDYPPGGYNTIFMVDNQTGWAAGDGGIIIHTTNGYDWFEQDNPDPDDNTAVKVFFLNASEGWVAATQGRVMHTKNGGETWNIEAEGLATNTLTGIHFTTSTNGYVVGNGTTLLKYTQVSSIEDNTKTIEFDLFPNPADESVRIHCSEFKTGTGTIEVLSPEGRTLQRRTVGKGNTDIEMDLKDLAAGMYMCRITIGNKSSTRRLVVE